MRLSYTTRGHTLKLIPFYNGGKWRKSVFIAKPNCAEFFSLKTLMNLASVYNYIFSVENSSSVFQDCDLNSYALSTVEQAKRAANSSPGIGFKCRRIGFSD